MSGRCMSWRGGWEGGGLVSCEYSSVCGCGRGVEVLMMGRWFGYRFGLMDNVWLVSSSVVDALLACTLCAEFRWAKVRERRR